MAKKRQTKADRQEELAKLADHYGKLQAQIADLEAERNKLRDALVAANKEEVEGKLFRIRVNRAEWTRVDYRAIVEELHPIKQVLNKHTETQERVTVTVSTRT